MEELMSEILVRNNLFEMLLCRECGQPVLEYVLRISFWLDLFGKFWVKDEAVEGPFIGLELNVY
jgi:hypothetical protein